MNSRRDFLSNLALGLSAMIFTPKIIKPTFRDTLRFNRQSVCEVLNPAWIEAPYEVAVFTHHQGQWNVQVVQRRTDTPDGPLNIAPAMTNVEFHDLIYKHNGYIVKDPCPMRLNWDKTYIPPYIKA